uniref:Uncharacterized protein n=1 Tax=Anguilla anguilla TaxID=7936 RepID=A0A0E9Q0W9_ANGAN
MFFFFVSKINGLILKSYFLWEGSVFC